MNLESLREFDIRDIDIRNSGDWPRGLKVAAGILLVGIVLTAGFKFLTAKTLDELERAQEREQQLRDVFRVKHKQAVNLDVYREQLAEMEQSFDTLRRQLPDTTEVAQLLVEITQAGLGKGLEFELFEPKSEKPAEFYAELPISIQVTGSYHQLAAFASEVAAFPRIVTMHDLTIRPREEGTLVMTGSARTYRYLDQD